MRLVCPVEIKSYFTAVGGDDIDMVLILPAMRIGNLNAIILLILLFLWLQKVANVVSQKILRKRDLGWRGGMYVSLWMTNKNKTKQKRER